MSNDVARFDVTMGFVHDLWKGPIELGLLGYFIYREIGFYGWIGIGFLLCFIPLQSKLKKKNIFFLSNSTWQFLRRGERWKVEFVLENYYRFETVVQEVSSSSGVY